MARLSHLLAAAAAFAGLAVARPGKKWNETDPATNGFPSPNAQQLLDIENVADGQLPNGAPPASLKNSSLTAFQLIAFNELFEVAFFTSLYKNVSGCVPGYEFHDSHGLAKILETIIAQEELHAINAINVLNHFGVFAPTSCEYTFGVDSLGDALALAETFTSVVLGTLQDAEQLLATNGDVGPTRPVASVIGQEGEQNGYFRSLLLRKPSEKPFLTTSVAPFAWSALQGFVVSCPYPVSNIPIPIFPALSVEGGLNVSAKDQSLSFSADLSQSSAAASYVGGSGSGLYTTYFIGQNIVSEPISNVKWSGKTITFEANFPFSANAAFGLSIASLTTSNTFSSPDDVPNTTLAAPGLIQVNDEVW